MSNEALMKSLVWLGSSRKDFNDFPDEVKSEMGYALFQAQIGGRHRKAKTFKGAGDAGIVEIVDDYRGDTFRTIYTVRFGSALYVLHASKRNQRKAYKLQRAT